MCLLALPFAKGEVSDELRGGTSNVIDVDEQLRLRVKAPPYIPFILAAKSLAATLAARFRKPCFLRFNLLNFTSYY